MGKPSHEPVEALVLVYGGHVLRSQPGGVLHPLTDRQGPPHQYYHLRVRLSRTTGSRVSSPYVLIEQWYLRLWSSSPAAGQVRDLPRRQLLDLPELRGLPEFIPVLDDPGGLGSVNITSPKFAPRFFPPPLQQRLHHRRLSTGTPATTTMLIAGSPLLPGQVHLVICPWRARGGILSPSGGPPSHRPGPVMPRPPGAHRAPGSYGRYVLVRTFYDPISPRPGSASLLLSCLAGLGVHTRSLPRREGMERGPGHGEEGL